MGRLTTIRRAALGVCLFLGTATAVSQEPLASGGVEAPHYEEVKCWFDTGDRPVSCGFMHVLESRSQTFSDIIQFPVVIFHSDSEVRRPDPVIELGGGGPGASMGIHGDDAALMWEAPEIFVLRTGRDLIVVDQRGVGFSRPNLECPEITGAVKAMLPIDMTAGEEISRFGAAAQRCHGRLIGAGRDLNAYNSAASARDIEELRQALGVRQWNLLGVSYAGRLALTVARDFPQGVRSVILDSPSIPSDLFYENGPYAFHRALTSIFGACEAQPVCGMDIAGFDHLLKAVKQRLNRSPAKVESWNPYTGEPLAVTINGRRFEELIFLLLYDSYWISRIPSIVARLYGGDHRDLDEMVETLLYSQLDPEWSDGVYYATLCREELPFNDLERSLINSRQYPIGAELHSNWIKLESTVCDLWNLTAADAIEQRAVISDIPTLVFTGGFDPVIPKDLGDALSRNLSSGQHMHFPQQTHNVLAGWDPCAVERAGAFLDDPRELLPPCADSEPFYFGD